MTKLFNTKIGERDIELLTAIDRCPLTPAQLCKLSETFVSPFNDEANMRRRFRKLASAQLVQCFPYVIGGDGRSPRYYKLTRDGYRLLYGKNASLPKRRYFQAISPGHHHHTYSMAETIVHLCVKAKENNCEVIQFARENSIKLRAEPFTLYPDSAFVIRRSDGRCFSFVLEYDNGTERVRSKQDVESIERKIRGYDAHQSQFAAHDPDRYLVLFITTRSKLRLKYILDVAADVMKQPQRRVFVGCELGDFLNADPFRNSVFEDHRGLRRMIVPTAAVFSDNKTYKTSTSFPKSHLHPVLS